MIINLPDDLAKKLEQRAKEKNFASLDDYLAKILQEIINKLDAKTQASYSLEEKEEIKKRLKNLGYD